ncbi:hypothetical protein L249_4093 [Ophiocordyceps polyrhachis-furcata BCC 54312]|uniref:Uncharacterized protein n=1 Tax=Ophiocordyceps polyrhachis-furcata BCC 54312 TaxID=1330021 RepID=A0A367L664_9HYPO|nr:hypothetical protein L249_4093 [Ophiocordyceps polyrhachis-furcata BCC 54312]
MLKKKKEGSSVHRASYSYICTRPSVRPSTFPNNPPQKPTCSSAGGDHPSHPMPSQQAERQAHFSPNVKISDTRPDPDEEEKGSLNAFQYLALQDTRIYIQIGSACLGAPSKASITASQDKTH